MRWLVNGIEELHGKIPVLRDNFEKQLKFSGHRFEIIESSAADKALHSVAISYYTNELILLCSFGNYLLLSESDQKNSAPLHNVETFLVQIVPGLSITEYTMTGSVFSNVSSFSEKKN